MGQASTSCQILADHLQFQEVIQDIPFSDWHTHHHSNPSMVVVHWVISAWFWTVFFGFSALEDLYQFCINILLLLHHYMPGPICDLIFTWWS